MRKVLFSLMTVALVGILVGGGIYAAFSDTETSTGNTFTAGTLNLQIGTVDPCTAHINISNVKPTDTGNAATWLVTNTGSIGGTLDVAISAITNNENGRSEVETAAGDSSDNIGELGGLLKVAFWMDTNKDGAWSSGDYFISSAGVKVPWVSGTTLPSNAYDILNNYGSESCTNVQTIGAALDAGNFRVEYNFPSSGSGDNVAQSDSCVFDITFTLNQQ